MAKRKRTGRRRIRKRGRKRRRSRKKVYAGSKRNKSLQRIMPRLPVKGYAKLKACIPLKLTSAQTKSVNAFYFDPINTLDPMGTAGSVKYDGTTEWATFYDIATVYKFTISYKVINKSVSTPHYVWMVVSTSTTSPVATGDSFAKICQINRLLYKLVRAEDTTHTISNFHTLKYTIYSKEFLKGRGTTVWPTDVSHAFGATAPTARIYVHVGLTNFEDAAFATSTDVLLGQLTIRANIGLTQREIIL